MSWKEHYAARSVSAAEAAGKIKSGWRIATGHATGSPETLVNALVDRASELHDVEIVHMVAMSKGRYCEPQYRENFRHVSIFAGGLSREAIRDGRAEMVPRFFSEIPSLFTDGSLPLDAALIMVSPPDKHGFVNMGVSVDYTQEAARTAACVIAEVSPHVPRIPGTGSIHVSDIDWFVQTEAKLIELQPPKVGEVEKRIGQNVASLVKDGDCLQLGIGAIPDAVLTFLDDKKDLGIHSEMISDGVMRLVEKGVVTGKKKTLHPGKIVITFAMGTQNFYEWLDANQNMLMHPVDYVNDPRVIGKNENLVSINSAISVDMLGQVAADMMGPLQFSGVGGQVDFVRGALLSRGGRSIIAMPSTAAKGTVSRVCAALERGQCVTTSRYDVDYVITEYGIAHLRGKNIRQRAGQLINIAESHFRDELFRETVDLYGWEPVGVK